MDSGASIENIQLIKKYSADSPARTILIIGVFHGEEPQGEYIISRYLKEKDFSAIKNHLYFIPCLNPWGKERGIRVNQNGVDLNRNYPTQNWIETKKDENYSGDEPASEKTTQQMIALLAEIKPDSILTLHAPLKCVNYDGPAKELAEIISEKCGFPVIADLGYPTPGSFGTYCGIERSIPTITLELDDEESNEKCYERTLPVLEYLANLS
ncbi:MAG TPA: DUF2817 domain-containing protein [Draconibacterium sp.]|nr:DUF2817 domain-containing protein [Draconibacterium sp.]